MKYINGNVEFRVAKGMCQKTLKLTPKHVQGIQIKHFTGLYVQEVLAYFIQYLLYKMGTTSWTYNMYSAVIPQLYIVQTCMSQKP